MGMLVAGMLVSHMSHAQQQKTGPRIGYLSFGDCKTGTYWKAFEKGLGEHGYVVDKNVELDCRNFRPERGDVLREIVRDLVRENVDVIVAPGTQVTVAVKAETDTIPIVMVAVADPVGEGLVSSLARPGGNITGLSNMMSDVAGKRLELLRDVAPSVSHVAVLFNPANAGNVTDVKAVEAAPGTKELTLHMLEVRAPSDIEAAFSSMRHEGDGALLVSADPLIYAHLQRVVDLAAENKLPAIYSHSGFTKAGGLMAYAPDLGMMTERAGWYVGEILKGAKPADMPVEQPRKFDLVINLKTARALGLSIPPSLLARADEVIE
jgi:putative ABC transport system substrate-binding protein